MQTRKTKPIKLEWTGGILSDPEENLVVIRDKKRPAVPAQESKQRQKITGTVNIRMEKKGRAGKPVAILFGFSDAAAAGEENLKALCSDLKTKLACGGTVEDGQIVLMTRDLDHLMKILKESFALDARRK